MGQSDAKAWIEQVSRGNSQRRVARDAGINEGTLNRQLVESAITPETVVLVARAYGVRPVDGLLALGLLQPCEVPSVDDVQRAIGAASDVQLAKEVLSRVRAASGPSGWLAPIDLVDCDDDRPIVITEDGSAQTAPPTPRPRSGKGSARR